MSSPTAESVLRAGLTERRPSFFLSLAPTTSASYPQNPSSRAPAAKDNSTTENTQTEEAQQPEASSRRSSSSSTTGFKVLKLGPVYWGEHADDHKEDFHMIPSPQ